MRTWVQTVKETATLYSPIGLRLIDDFTGKTPLGRIDVLLDIQDAPSTWRANWQFPSADGEWSCYVSGARASREPEWTGERGGIVCR
jgi:hypothetical protein